MTRQNKRSKTKQNKTRDQKQNKIRRKQNKTKHSPRVLPHELCVKVGAERCDGDDGAGEEREAPRPRKHVRHDPSDAHERLDGEAKDLRDCWWGCRGGGVGVWGVGWGGEKTRVRSGQTTPRGQQTQPLPTPSHPTQPQPTPPIVCHLRAVRREPRRHLSRLVLVVKACSLPQERGEEAEAEAADDPKLRVSKEEHAPVCCVR